MGDVSTEKQSTWHYENLISKGPPQIKFELCTIDSPVDYFNTDTGSTSLVIYNNAHFVKKINSENELRYNFH